MKTNSLFSLLPLLLLAIGFTSWSAVGPQTSMPAASLEIADVFMPDQVSALQFLPKAAKMALKNEKTPQFKVDAKGVLTPGRGHAIALISNGAVVCPELMVTDMRRLYLDKYPSLKDVQRPGIVRCICPSNQRNDCRTIELPRSENGSNKYCMGTCECSAVIQYIDLEAHFKSWRDMEGRWHNF